MLGCCRRPAARASFLKRFMYSSARSGSSRSLRTVLIATERSICGSNALYTTPIAPLPRTLRISYLPSFVGSVMAVRRRLRRDAAVGLGSGLEHLHRLHEARLHPRQRLG